LGLVGYRSRPRHVQAVTYRHEHVFDSPRGGDRAWSFVIEDFVPLTTLCGTGSSPTYPGLGVDPDPYLLDKLRVG
jgi:hypothetical protein